MKKIIGAVIFMFAFSFCAFAQGKETADASKEAAPVKAIKKEHPTAAQATRGLYWNNSIGISYNYLGFKIESTLYYSVPLIEKPGILFKTTKIDVGLQELWTPSCNRVSYYMKLEPLAIFDVVFTAGYDYIYKELYGGIYKFTDRDVRKNNYCSNNDDRKDKSVSETSGGGFRMAVTPTFKVAFKGLALLYSFTAEYHDVLRSHDVHVP